MDRMEFLILAGVFCLLINSCNADYQIGVGRADCTGPVAEIVFMGYAKTSQKGMGLHLRQFARAFIIKDDKTTIAFVSVDAGMVGNGLRQAVIRRLSQTFGNTYNDENLIISGTHTHSAPGGFLMDLLFDISTFGFVRQTFEALESGITRAVMKAHKNLVSGKIFISSGELLEANINRSPKAYELNPENERKLYKYNVDKEMVQMKFVSSDNRQLGVINWFPVHPTSMNNTNRLVSSDNVGYASILFESAVNKGAMPGKGEFVAAFASTNLGDVSPNIMGPRCLNTGEKCDDVHSTCDGEAKFCVASGPGKDMFDSTKLIAERLNKRALELWKSLDSYEVTGPLSIRHRFVDMPNEKVNYTFPNGTVDTVNGCLPAMGYSFAAGTTDGPGEFDFKQGTTSTNPLWNKIRDFIAAPTAEDITCQQPKPILLATGRIKYPYQWQPSIVSIQLAFIGDIALVAVPGEFTTMAGRRLRNAVSRSCVENGLNLNKVIIAGLSNVYSDYITTPEEYQLQRYEAASTIFGPYTLLIYLKLYSQLVEDILQKREAKYIDVKPPEFKNLISLVPPVLFDLPWFKNSFGDCILQPPAVVKRGTTVTVGFVAGHPRNRLLHGKTFLTIEKQTEKQWTVVATDASWETKFTWTRLLAAKSQANVTWDVGYEVLPGTYRIRHFGNYKSVFGGIYPYEGSTNIFKVT